MRQKRLRQCCGGDANTPHMSGTKNTRRARGASAKTAMSLVAQAANLLARIERELNGLQPSYVMRQAIKTVNDGRSEIERWLAAAEAPTSAKTLPQDATITGPEGTFPIDTPDD
ncbi:MAG: hypothetical protein ACRD2H_05115 [Terriglobales bacterium]